MGDLLKLATEPKTLNFENLSSNTRLTYADVDAGPTKAFMILNRDQPEIKMQWDLGFGPRPSEELYELKSDPHQIKNLSQDPTHQKTREILRAQLMAELKKHNDPRLEGNQFDFPPYCKIGLEKK